MTLTLTNNATLTWQWQSVVALHSCAGYRSPGSNTVACQFAYEAGQVLTTLQWTAILRDGWSLLSVTGDGGPHVVGTNIVFDGPFTTNRLAFDYIVDVPAGQGLTNEIRGSVQFRLVGMAGSATAVASPSPLVVESYHSADYRSPYWVIDGTEVNRVLAYWRAGAYHMEPLGHDGYAPGDGNTDGYKHSADYQASDWEIDIDEASRVLAYWRSGGYRRDESGADGFASLDDGKTMNGPPAVNQAGPSCYDPGGTIAITNTFNSSQDLLSLCWKPRLPVGWTVVSVEGQGSPELQRGDVLWTAGIPSTPLQMVYVVQVPLWELRAREIGAQVGCYVAGDVNASQLSPAPAALVLSPRDTDGDGMPDGWEAHYGDSGTGMLPDSDDDGDGMVNLHECVAGTDPLDEESVLALSALTPNTDTTVVIEWHSATDRLYSVGESEHLPAGFRPVASNIPATPPVNALEVTTEGEALFYRVTIEP